MIGIDVGATTISGGLVTAEGEIVDVVSVPTHRDGPGSAVETLFEVIGEQRAQARGRDLALDGVGVGLPSAVDAEKGMMLGPLNYVREFVRLPLAERIQAATGLPAFVDNDVNALALAEWTFGLGRGATSLVLLAIGTGLGGGIIVDGRLVRGHRGYAGEFGHVPIHLDGPRCFCGSRGCLAAYLSGRMMAEAARTRLDRERGSAMVRLAGGDPRSVTSELIFEAAREGDELARELVDRACDALGAGLAVIVNALNPEVIVVAGGVATSLAPLEHLVLERAARYGYPSAFDGTRVHIVGGDKRQTVRGGAALVLYELARREAVRR